MQQLNGKVAFITGGGGGIGGGIAQAFIEQGMNVVLADISLEHAQEQAKNPGSNTLTLPLDVTSLDSWDNAKKAAMEAFGHAIVQNPFYIISHPAYKTVLENRFSNILSAHGKSAEEAFCGGNS